MGFIAILVTTSRYGDVQKAILGGSLILLAMLFDGCDGVVARLLKANSRLGAQLDSLADLVAFGVAPASLMYSFLLFQIDYTASNGITIPAGMLTAAVWPACTAYRLARFNVGEKGNTFIGLPAPVAASIIALIPLTAGTHFIHISEFLWVILYLFCAFMMVSTIRYTKIQSTVFKRFSRGRIGIILMFLFCSTVFIIWHYGVGYAATGLFTIILLYMVTGLVSLVIHTIQKYRI